VKESGKRSGKYRAKKTTPAALADFTFYTNLLTLTPLLKELSFIHRYELEESRKIRNKK